MVVRWEDLPGSTLDAGGNQGRRGPVGQEGNAGVGGELRGRFDLRADNTFLVKVSYWLNR